MRIKRIDIDGFKSYAQRTVIENFDSQFNAITGLNGSGKSNILDSICFVLGITNLHQVRAAQLSDLVYKQGQAGISRATVSITFDNTDPSNRPIGFDKYDELIVRRQIVINGRNSYTINGVSATNNRVVDLFRSVGLNVNNPHFLIMQGRVTKVLNMKPMEILGMIEEAAGTRMYEAKKQSALRMIEKKEYKLTEIKQVMEEDILPMVEKLKQDRGDFLEYQRIDREVEGLQRKVIAYDVFSSQLAHQKINEDMDRIHAEICDVDADIETKKGEVVKSDRDLKEMEEEKRAKHDNQRKLIEDRLQQLTSSLTLVENQRDAINDKIKESNKSTKRIAKNIQSDKKELDRKESDLKKMESESGGDETRGKNAETAVKMARAKLEAIAKGLTTDDDGNAVSLDAQLTTQRSALCDLETNLKICEMKVKNFQSTLPKKKEELNRVVNKSESEEAERANLNANLKNFEKELSKISYKEDEEAQLANNLRTLHSEAQSLAEEKDVFEARYYKLKFDYKRPTQNFDQRSIRGIVANLFKVKEMRFANTLEVVAGSYLWAVVVQTAQTAQDLLMRGDLPRRVTFIPLDKIRYRCMSPKALNRAYQLVGKSDVFYALDLIEYDEELAPAMRFIFGNTLICTTDKNALMVAFDPQVETRTVSVPGLDVHPDGLMTGGARPKQNPFLLELNAIHEKRCRLEDISSRITIIKDRHSLLLPLKAKYIDLINNQEKCMKRLKVVEEYLQNTPLQILTNAITEIEKELKENTSSIAEKSRFKAEIVERIRELEKRKKDEKAYLEREKKQVKADLVSAEAELVAIKESFENAKLTLETLRSEIGCLRKSIAEEEVEWEILNRIINEGNAEIAKFEFLVTEKKKTLEEVQNELHDYDKRMRQHDARIRDMMECISGVKKQIKEAEFQRNSLKNDLTELKKNASDCSKRVLSLEKKYLWISDEKKHFGREGSAYDFANFTLEHGKNKLERLLLRKRQLEGTISAKAMQMLGAAEEQCHQLESKKMKLEADKAVLMRTIAELDIKKENEVLKAHENVNQDFGNIFSTLLPGTTAKLAPAQGASSALGGLEIKVAFHNNWKDSLGELSGGQRSLAALSLILAMLKFKPAPIYILDEVDAALDLSHTQNIGAMIKSYFKESQFIIVSLKDGMFNHANVLFTTQFVDGTSTVNRIENRNDDDVNDVEKENDGSAGTLQKISGSRFTRT